jgi:hypothetical protein
MHKLIFYAVQEEVKTVTLYAFMYSGRDWQNILEGEIENLRMGEE